MLINQQSLVQYGLGKSQAMNLMQKMEQCGCTRHSKKVIIKQKSRWGGKVDSIHFVKNFNANEGINLIEQMINQDRFHRPMFKKAWQDRLALLKAIKKQGEINV